MLNSVAERRTADSGIVRCPLFKIDLKGRFVYVDEMTERLLGRPQDLLFGRSLGNFLSEQSWSTLSAIFQRYRHYETSFEALELEFTSPNSEKQTLMAVISLNFIAGNPANYQVVLIPALTAVDPVSDFSRQEKLFALLFELVSTDDGGEVWKKLAEIMMQLDEICQAGIYQYHDKSLILIPDSSGAKSGTNAEMSPVNEYHLDAVLNNHPYINAEYSMTDETGALPGKIFTEVCYPLMHGESCWGMARFVVDKDSLSIEETLLRASRFIGNALFRFVGDIQKG